MPALAEGGALGFDIYHSIAEFGPTALARDIVAKLNAEIGRMLMSPTVHERLTASGREIAPSTPAHLGAWVRDGMQRWGKLLVDTQLELK